MFEKFFVFYREYPDEETTSASEWESMAVSYHSAGVASGSIPANGFKWMSKDALVNTASIQSLKSDTRYRILVKTFIEDPKTSEKYYDNGKVVINCKTSKRKLIWDGWNDIMATAHVLTECLTGQKTLQIWPLMIMQLSLALLYLIDHFLQMVWNSSL